MRQQPYFFYMRRLVRGPAAAPTRHCQSAVSYCWHAALPRPAVLFSSCWITSINFLESVVRVCGFSPGCLSRHSRRHQGSERDGFFFAFMGSSLSSGLRVILAPSHVLAALPFHSAALSSDSAPDAEAAALCRRFDFCACARSNLSTGPSFCVDHGSSWCTLDRCLGPKSATSYGRNGTLRSVWDP